MNVTSKISVDLTRQNVGQRVNAVQGDGNTRLVEITLLCGGVTWTPPEGVEAAISYYQPGGHKGLYNLLADGSAAISMAGNVATIILAPQMLTASGTVQASLVFNDQHLNRLTTFPFSVSVASNPAAGAQKVEDYLRLQWLEEKLEEYLAAIKASGVFDGKPGDNGVTFTPSVSENGDLSWRNNGGLPNPQTVNIRGTQGDSTAATAAANAAKTSAANAETHAAYAAASAAAAQATVGAMGTELSQIKGDLSNKLPKSPADWEAWTAEEQAAARERMGLAWYELIVDVPTLETASDFHITMDSNGNALALKAVAIDFAGAADGSTCLVEINNGYLKFVASFSQGRFGSFVGIPLGNDYYCYCFTNSAASINQTNGNTNNFVAGLKSDTTIRDIWFRGTVPVGASIQIYGIRR